MKLPSESESVKALRVTGEFVLLFSLFKSFGTFIFEKGALYSTGEEFIGF